ncbi:MAG: hypothetical protein LBQ80_04590 [Clostridium sp.]|jgi:ElaB/YqjD/DUF883 family membrane-anchored ribosome-binding protein|nr:hypothetical protein [Clostridium sp.]
MSVRELKVAISYAASNLDSQIRELHQFVENNNNLMQQISQELEGSANSSAANMKEALARAKEQINHTIGLVENAKTKLLNYSSRL